MNTEHIYGGTACVAFFVMFCLLVWAAIRYDKHKNIRPHLFLAFVLMVYFAFWMGSR